MKNMNEFAQRRKRLLHKIGKGSIAIIPAALEVLRNGDAHYPYRQHSDFFYLTGFPEPEAIAVFIPGRKQGEFILFSRPHDAAAERWNGKRAGQAGAVKQYGAAEAYAINDFEKLLSNLLQEGNKLYFNFGHQPALDEKIIAGLNKLRSKTRSGYISPNEVVDLDQLIHEMRLFKSPAEIDLMRQAGKISAQAHCRAMKACRPGMMEYQLEAEILHEFFRHGSRAVAYDCIVGGGENSCVLHYRDNSSRLREGDLVLIDAGCEYQYYAADITRTFPVNGRFSQEQRAIYEIVLAAQLEGIKHIRPGTPWHKIHQATARVITEGLVALGLLKGKVSDLVQNHAYQAFYMHQAGHWLGMDVHDVGAYQIQGQWRHLEPGMAYGLSDVITLRQLLDNSEMADERKKLEKRKLEALLGFCETTLCRRQILLNYFDEKYQGPCHYCDNCLAPAQVWDGTTAAQMALSCVYRTGQRFGVKHLTDVLAGKTTPQIQRFRHHNISTYGIGKAYTPKQWESIFRQLVAAGLLAVDAEGYGGLRLTADSRPYLRGEKTIHFRTDSEIFQKKAKSKAPKEKPSSVATYDSSLLQLLKSIRLQLARAQGVPPYIIFHDSTLLEIQEKRPQNLTEFGNITGVGKQKLERYGKIFLEALQAVK